MFTIYTRVGRVLMRTDNEDLAHMQVMRGNTVTRCLFGQEVPFGS